MISEKNNWGEKEILERCSWIAKEIIQIWKCPDILSANQDKVDNRIEFDIMDEVNVTGRTEEHCDLVDEKIDELVDTFISTLPSLLQSQLVAA